MAVRWQQIVIDAEDPARLARWWAAALGYRIVYESPDEIAVQRTEQDQPGLLFVPVPEVKAARNRLHLDLRPDDQEAEIERLVDMGARPVRAGTHATRWVVLADPEGNEFCVLASTGTAR